MGKYLLYALCCSASLMAASAAIAADGVKDLLDKVAVAYGGTPPAAVIETGKTMSFRRGEGTLKRVYKSPDHFHIRIDYATAIESRTMIGPDAWQQGNPANPILRGAIALQLARIALPWNMLAQRSAVDDLGAVSAADGKPLRALEYRMEEGLKLIVDVNPDTGRIVRSRGIYTLGQSTMEFATEYANFRAVNGRTHAMREEHYAMGQHTGFSIIDSVDYPKEIPDNAFPH